MKIVSIATDRAVISLSAKDIELVIACMRETIECVDDFEFQTRVGFSKEYCKLMIKEYSCIYKQTTDSNAEY